jgi:omega-6 fatty acid desaturase (delta-12 desaturase)
MSVQVSAPPRIGKTLHDATRPFAAELVGRSWWAVLSTGVLLAAALALAALAPTWPLRLLGSVLGALLLVRVFILYHDYMHGALLPKSPFARWLFHAYGLLVLTPARSWRDSHNYHHANVGKITGSGVGSFPLLTTHMWRDASRGQRLMYRMSRSPVTILLAYATVFLANICLLSLVRSPRRHWDSAVSIVAHAVLITAVWAAGGFATAFFALLLPMALASAMGGYLFYAQHNFRGMQVMAPEEWTYYEAALKSSSCLELGRVMHWFTGNIGYHHVHHLNPLIPFYRLPEAMAAIPELQGPIVTRLRPREILDCFKLALWDPERKRMVSFSEAAA